jgi:hypothetical protein
MRIISVGPLPFQAPTNKMQVVSNATSRHSLLRLFVIEAIINTYILEQLSIYVFSINQCDFVPIHPSLLQRMHQQQIDVDPASKFQTDTFESMNRCSIQSPDMPWTCKFNFEDGPPCLTVNRVSIGFCEKCCANRWAQQQQQQTKLEVEDIFAGSR